MMTGESIKQLLDQLEEQDKVGDAAGCVATCRNILDLLPRDKIPELWAAIQGTLADKLLQDPAEGADGAEQALTHYELALEVLSEEANDQQWAGNHGQAGRLYMTRTTGARAQNLARAVEHFRSSLRVFDRDPTTMDWAATHASLGEALAELGGHRTEVIDHLEAALTIITKSNRPGTWLRSKIALAHAHSKQGPRGNSRAVMHLKDALTAAPALRPDLRGRIRGWVGQYRRDSMGGFSSEGVEETLTAFKEALVDFEGAGNSDFVRRTHAELGHTYAHRMAGDRAENVTKAIGHLEIAVQMSDEDDPGLALLHAPLGRLYDDESLRDGKGNVTRPEFPEKAIAHYTAALRSQGLEGSARGSVHARLGTAYAGRIEGERSENLNIAIDNLERALDFDLGPEELARVHRNISTALRDRAQGQGKDIEGSLEHGRQALALSDAVLRPLAWADAQRTLAGSYLARDVGNPAQNIEAAIAHLEAAQNVVTQDVDRERWAKVHLGLAKAHSDHPNRTRDRALASATHCREAQSVFTHLSHPELWRECEAIVSSVLEADPLARAGRAWAAKLKDRLVANDPFAEHPDALLKRLGDPALVPRGSTEADMIGGLIRQFAPQIRATVVSRAGGSMLRENDVLRIGVIDDWELSAQVVTEPPYDVHISTNLVRYCSNMSGLLMAGMGIALVDDDGSQVGGNVPPTLSHAQIAVHVRHIMKAFLREQEIPLAPTEAGAGHVVLTSQIFFSTLAFLISHEFGHVIIAEARRQDKPPPFLDFAEALLNAAFDRIVTGQIHQFDSRGLDDLDSLDLGTVKRRWAEEIACDVVGASLALEFQSRHGPWSGSPDILPAAKFAIHLALVSQMMLSLYGNLVARAPIMTPTHPPFDFRTFCVLKWMYGDRIEEAERPITEYLRPILTELLSDVPSSGHGGPESERSRS